MNIRIQLVGLAIIPMLRELIEASVRGLQAGDYSPAQLEGLCERCMEWTSN